MTNIRKYGYHYIFPANTEQPSPSVRSLGVSFMRTVVVLPYAWSGQTVTHNDVQLLQRGQRSVQSRPLPDENVLVSGVFWLKLNN